MGGFEFAGATKNLRSGQAIVQFNLDERTGAHLPRRLLAITNDGGSALLCLDWQLGDLSPVVAWDLHTFASDIIVYAENLDSWLRELIDDA